MLLRFAWAIVLTILAVPTRAWHLPPVNVATAAPASSAVPTTTTTTTTSAASAPSLQINIPALLELVRTPEARRSTIEKASFLGQSARYLVPPEAVSVAPPADFKAFVQQALQGKAALQINAEVSNDDGDENKKKNTIQQSVHVQIIATDWGVMTVQIRNPLLPKLPLVGLPDTPSIVTDIVAPTIEQTAPVAMEVAQNVFHAAASQPPLAPPAPPAFGTMTPVTLDWLKQFWEQEITPIDILGSVSLALGITYGSSYAYYLTEQERESLDALERQQAMGAKRKAATADQTINKESTLEAKDSTATDARKTAVEKIQDVKGSRESGEQKEPASGTSMGSIAVELAKDVKISPDNDETAKSVESGTTETELGTGATYPTSISTPNLAPPPPTIATVAQQELETAIATLAPPVVSTIPEMSVLVPAAPQPQLQRSKEYGSSSSSSSKAIAAGIGHRKEKSILLPEGFEPGADYNRNNGSVTSLEPAKKQRGILGNLLRLFLRR